MQLDDKVYQCVFSTGPHINHLWLVHPHGPHLHCHKGFSSAPVSEKCPSLKQNRKGNAQTHHYSICLMLYASDTLINRNWEALALVEVPKPSLSTHRHMIWAARPWPLVSSRPIYVSHITRAKVMLWLLAFTHILHWSLAEELSLTAV